jgi:hypothetical protein
MPSRKQAALPGANRSSLGGTRVHPGLRHTELMAPFLLTANPRRFGPGFKLDLQLGMAWNFVTPAAFLLQP